MTAKLMLDTGTLFELCAPGECPEEKDWLRRQWSAAFSPAERSCVAPAGLL